MSRDARLRVIDDVTSPVTSTLNASRLIDLLADRGLSFFLRSYFILISLLPTKGTTVVHSKSPLVNDTRADVSVSRITADAVSQTPL
jgi:hypothetical protein